MRNIILLGSTTKQNTTQMRRVEITKHTAAAAYTKPNTGIMENHMEKRMENEMEIGIILGYTIGIMEKKMETTGIIGAI